MAGLTDREVSQLKYELYEARRFIVESAPKQFQDILNTHRSCVSRQDVFDWEEDLIESIIKATEGEDSDREKVHCPLCGAGGVSPNANGFTLPLELKRHLIGYGRMRQCHVIEAAVSLAWWYLDTDLKIS